LESARDKLLVDPWIQGVNIRRKFPNVLVINVTERSPAAVVMVGDKTWIIAVDGMVLAEGIGFSLPLLRGLDLSEPVLGSKLTGPTFETALEYVEAFQPLESQMSDFNFESYPGIIALYTNDGYKVIMDDSTDDPSDRVLDLIALLQELRGAHLKGQIDLRAGFGRGIFTPWPEGEDTGP
jgi:cell division septal protein FtsQ